MSTLIAILALAVALFALRTARRAKANAEMIAGLNTRFMRAVNQISASRDFVDQLQDEIRQRQRAGGGNPLRVVHDQATDRETETDARWSDLEMPEA